MKCTVCTFMGPFILRIFTRNRHPGNDIKKQRLLHHLVRIGKMRAGGEGNVRLLYPQLRTVICSRFGQDHIGNKV